MSALGQKQTCAVHYPMSALPPKADVTATNNGAAHPLPQQMIKMLTVGAFGNDMAAAPSLVGLAAASSASSVTSQARTASSLSLQIVSMGLRIVSTLPDARSLRFRIGEPVSILIECRRGAVPANSGHVGGERSTRPQAQPE